MTDKISERRVIDFDVETTGLQKYSPHELFMAQFFDPDDDECWVYPEYDEDADFADERSTEPAAVILRHPEDREEIQRWLDKDAYFRAWNAKFDTGFLEEAGYKLPPQDRWEDGMLIAHALDERRSVALQAIGDKLFGTPDQNDAEGNPKVWPEGAGAELEKGVREWISAENKARRKRSKETGEKFVIANYSDVPDELMEPYAAHDVELQRRICDAIVPQLEANPDLVGVYELERKVLAALYDVEKLGMGIDREGAEKFEVQLENDLTQMRLDMFELAGDDEFNPNSGAQLEEALLRRGVDLSHIGKSGKSGRRSMAADVLEGLDDALARKIEDFRGADKMMSTYIRPLLHDDPDTTKGYRYATLRPDGRLHTDLRQVGARTGRMSSSPNVQNWPRDDLRMRHLVMADEGKKLVAVDLDSIELVLFAAFLGKESEWLRQLTAPDADPHTYTAKMLGMGARKRSEGVSESPRQRGKKFNYCRSLSTEILTREGWKNHDEVVVGDETLGYDAALDRSRWTPIIGIHRGRGDLYSVGNAHWRQSATADHRWLTSPMRRKSAASEIYNPGGITFSSTQELSREHIIHHSKRAEGGPGIDLAEFNREDPNLPIYVLSMTAAQRQAWLHALMLGEVTECRNGRWSFSQLPGPVFEAGLLAIYLEGWQPRTHGGGTSPTLQGYCGRSYSTGARVTCEPLGAADVWCVQTELGSWTAREGKEIGLTGNSMIYGGGIKTVVKNHGVDQNIARKWLQRYNDAYPEVEEFKDTIELRLEERGFIKTPFGRRHRAYNPQFAERESYKFVNYLVQGTAADLFKEAVVRAHEAGIEMTALTHDEILCEADAAEAEEVKQLVTGFMTDFPKINKLVQITADGQIVDRWSQAKDPEFDPGW